uniref:BolA-like protein 3 n=1 Tax=Macaca fascicularis TaxID=9541 RepID=A0A2K5UTT7_MACFA|nr:bolA-like protein 3 isoform X1 [Macaca fascicularis]
MASGRQGAASPKAAALGSLLRVFRAYSDLGRRVASAGHGGMEPGRGSASASQDPRAITAFEISSSSALWGSSRAGWRLKLPLHHRMFATQTEGELRVTQILKEKFPRATAIKVTDISGGCGAMYEIKIESEEFKEKRTVQQHQMVNQALKEEIKEMHGLRIFTSVPKR